MYKIYKGFLMLIGLLPLILKGKRKFSDSIKLLIEQEEHMDAGLNIYDGYRRAFHYNRYIFANKYLNNKNHEILDIACGFGYGSNYLSNNNKSITGVDISNYAIKYAKKYYNDKNIIFIEGDASNINLNKKFDKIISFETIEHLPTDDLVNKYLQNLRNHLNNDGLFFCSSPNKWGITEYHFQDYNYEEFKEKLENNGFKIIDSYKQNSGEINRKENHGEIGGIYKIENENDKNNAEVILLVARKC